MNNEQQQSQLKLLIAKGKEQGYLTYHEVNDHLPPGIVDPEQIEDIVNMINDMGITVHETPPDRDSLLMANATATDDEVAEEAAAALVTVDSELGRTTDPVRMYMREMGTVELLTREGEIKIAKRIEEGLLHMTLALVAFPGTTLLLMEKYYSYDRGETRLRDLLAGFNDLEALARDEPPVPKKTEDGEEEVKDLGPDPEEVRERFEKLGVLSVKVNDSITEHGAGHAETKEVLADLINDFRQLKLKPKIFEHLLVNLKEVVARIRSCEREIMDICIHKARMPRKEFITSFPKNETDPN